jgi:hypothetical protein
LIGLVPLAQGVAELLAQVEDALADDCATVEEEGGGVEGVSGLVVFLSVGHAYVFVCGLEELGPQLIFKLWGSSIGLYVLQVFVEFELIEFLLLELAESLLDGGFGREVEEIVVFFVGAVFHILRLYENK